MNKSQSKKLLIINILKILRRYSDENHRMSQKEIADILENEYDMKVDRKSIRRNLIDLIDSGYDIEYSETPKEISLKDGSRESSAIMSDFYLNREFSDSELRMLIDGILFSRHIPYGQSKALIKKLEGLSSVHFKSRVKYIRSLTDNFPRNRQILYTIDVLDEAIAKKRQVSFVYNEYGTDKKLHPCKSEDGKIREYIINPYQMAAANGRHYLICNYDKYDDLSNYRIDRITEIKLLDSRRKPLTHIKGAENGLNLPKHMAEHIYMYSGKSVRVVMLTKKYIINDLIDWFGKDIKFYDETETEVRTAVYANEEAMRKWAMQYALHIKLLSPDDLVEKLKTDLLSAAEKYE